MVTAIPTSTSAGPSVHRLELEIAGHLTRILVDQIRSIGVDYVVGDPADYLTQDQITEVELALAHYLGVHDVIPPRPS
jgi:mRNA interferase MazF